MAKFNLDELLCRIAGVERELLCRDFADDGYRDLSGKRRVTLSRDEHRIFTEFLFGERRRGTIDLAPYLSAGDAPTVGV